ncbi:MAG: type II toxin-antitoxin system VapC family toxin [Tannerella sp.]|jgi:tRNA(fMet)-specific endonuclease VapC|nr:type II toxin-antitoxin system VapC family toxin [Tannerella sp.]
MDTYLLDTNICIFFLRGKAEINAMIKLVGAENCYISEITIAELLYGVECDRVNVSQNRRLVEGFINNAQIIPVSDAIRVYAKEKARLRRSGILIDDMDIFIGSTAIAHDMILVTDNAKHLSRLSGIKTTNWVIR